MVQNTGPVEMYGRSCRFLCILWRGKIFFERYSFGALLILCTRNLQRRTAAANYRATCVDVNKQPSNFSIRAVITEKTRVNQPFFFNRKKLMNRKHNFLRDLHKFSKSITEDLTTNSCKNFYSLWENAPSYSTRKNRKNRKKMTVERKKKKRQW